MKFLLILFILEMDGLDRLFLEELLSSLESRWSDSILHLAEDHALIDEALKGFRAGQIAPVKQHLVPEAGVEQMQHGMFSPADIEIDRQPVFHLLRVAKSTVVLRIKIAKIVPA